MDHKLAEISHNYIMQKPAYKPSDRHPAPLPASASLISSFWWENQSQPGCAPVTSIPASPASFLWREKKENQLQHIQSSRNPREITPISIIDILCTFNQVYNMRIGWISRGGGGCSHGKCIPLLGRRRETINSVTWYPCCPSICVLPSMGVHWTPHSSLKVNVNPYPNIEKMFLNIRGPHGPQEVY